MARISLMLHLLDMTPNVPFFTKSIRQLVTGMAIAEGLNGNGVHIQNDSLGLYITLKRGKPRQRIFLCSHLDHPGFAFNNKGQGIPLGSVSGSIGRGVSGIKFPSEMDFYDRYGSFLTTAPVSVQPKWLTTKVHVPTNTVGMWHLENRTYSSNKIRMRSADNHVATAMLLETAASLWDTNEDLDLVLVFTSVEEIFQMSMTCMGLQNTIGSNHIKPDDVFIVVETMEMKPYHGETPNYEDGPLIKINDGDVGYGMGSNESGNIAEMLLLNAALGVEHQHSYSGGYTDATALSLFTKCPNIVTLAIPCVNKHNITPDGIITEEQVRMADISNGLTILKKVVTLKEGRIAGLLSPSLRNITSLNRGPERIKKYRQNRARLQEEFYFPQNPLQWLRLVRSRLF